MRTKKRKKRASHLRIVPATPTRVDERWSMDFVQDTLDDGRRFRALTLVDVFTRECLTIGADSSLSGHKVAALCRVHDYAELHRLAGWSVEREPATSAPHHHRRLRGGRSDASSLSGARKRPRRRVGGRTDSMASSFAVGSALR
jgi:hypothetical protein